MREELLNTPTLMRKEAVSASNRMIEEQLISQTLKRTDQVSTPTRMREEQLNTPTLMRTEAVSASNRMKEEQLNTPTLMRTKKLPNMSSNKENEFSFLSKRREDNVKDSCSPLPNAEVNLDIQGFEGYPFSIRFQRRQYEIPYISFNLFRIICVNFYYPLGKNSFKSLNLIVWTDIRSLCRHWSRILCGKPVKYLCFIFL